MFATRRKEAKAVDRVILHIDMNNFYASVETLYDPSLKDIPMAVGGDKERRHGIVLAKNMLAKAKGVKTAEALWEAERKCPGIKFVPPHFERYAKYSRLAKEIYMQYTDMVESFGLDECWLDVTGSRRLFGSGREIAEEIRARVKDELGLTVSIGVSFNKIFAKLGSDYKKPDAVTEFTRENFKELVWPLPAADLLFVGKSTQEALRKYGIYTIGGAAKADRKLLKRLFGKAGEQLSMYANGEDRSPVRRVNEHEEVKSIGNSTTAVHDLKDDGEIRAELYMLSESVAQRLREKGFPCANITSRPISAKRCWRPPWRIPKAFSTPPTAFSAPTTRANPSAASACACRRSCRSACRSARCLKMPHADKRPKSSKRRSIFCAANTVATSLIAASR